MDFIVAHIFFVSFVSKSFSTDSWCCLLLHWSSVTAPVVLVLSPEVKPLVVDTVIDLLRNVGLVIGIKFYCLLGYHHINIQVNISHKSMLVLRWGTVRCVSGAPLSQRSRRLELNIPSKSFSEVKGTVYTLMLWLSSKTKSCSYKPLASVLKVVIRRMARGPHPCPTSYTVKYQCSWSWHTWLLKRMGDHTDWFDICYAQNTPMTNKESKYNPFAPFASLCAQIICQLTSKIDTDVP